MKTISAFVQQKHSFWIAGFIAVLLLGIIVSVILADGLALSLTIMFFSLAVLCIVKPTWLFYSFMLLFVFSEINIGRFSIQASLSTLFSLLALCVVAWHSLTGKPIYHLLQLPRKRILALGLTLLFIAELFSAMLNSSFRPLTTRLAHLLTLVFVLIVVRDKATLWRGYYLGTISMGILGLLTVLTGLNLNTFGFRAAANWRSTPWEAYIPRSIGLPDMQGGLHAIFILAFLPLAVLLALNPNRLKLKSGMRSMGALASALGILALLVASYRSGWLGLLVSLSCLAIFHFRFSHSTKTGRVLLMFFVVSMLALILMPFGTSIYQDFYHLAFNVRSQGLEARFIQNNYVFDRMLTPSIHQVFGYGYEDFGLSFMRHIAQQGYNNPELYPWMHNYYLGLFYASGLLGMVLFSGLIFYVLKTLWQQAGSPDESVRMLNSAVFSSLAGILVVLLFTAETSGLHIMWVLIATSALIQQRLTTSHP